MDEDNHIDGRILFLRIIRFHYHHYADVSEGIKLAKCLSVAFSGVCA